MGQNTSLPLPEARVDSGPTPAFEVRRSATIPATYVDAQGISRGNNWPLITDQESHGYTPQGDFVMLSTKARQDAAASLARVTESSVVVYGPSHNRTGLQELRYALDFKGDGSVAGTGSAANVRLSPTEVLNLAYYFKNITDGPAMSGAQLDRGMELVRTKIGAVR